MTSLKVSVSRSEVKISKGTALVLGCLGTKDNNSLTSVISKPPILSEEALTAVGASHRRGAVARSFHEAGGALLLVGLGVGAATELTANLLRESAGVAARAAGGSKRLVLDLPHGTQSELAAIVEGAILGGYRFDELKSGTKEPALTEVTVLSTLKPEQAVIDAAVVRAEAVNRTRDLVNRPANLIYPQSLATAVRSDARGSGIRVEIWDEKRLATEKMGGILGVGQGSSRPPRLVVLDHNPKGAGRHLVLVGKGITFDTGGLSLKPADAMLGMKYDMTGAATVAQAAIACASLKLPVRVTALMAVAENMPSGNAMRPGDVIKIRGGKTVEVTNTDAEGRLVLADALVLASEWQPDLIVDIATLTGAASIALGNRHAGLMGDEAAVSQVLATADQLGEMFWPMPLPDDLRALLDSDIADIANAKVGNRAGGMLLGGLFLKDFVAKTPAGGSGKGARKHLWAHLDIANVANVATPFGYSPKGASGHGVRTLIGLAEAMAAGKLKG